MDPDEHADQPDAHPGEQRDDERDERDERLATAWLETLVPTWLAQTWVVAGVVGVVVALAGAAIGVAFVRGLTATSIEALALSETVLTSVDDAAVVLDTTLVDVATTLDTAGGTVDETIATLDEVATTLDDLTIVITEEVPDSLDAVGAAMPQVISTAGVIDSTMRALRFVGVDYDPSAPLDESLQEVDDQLAEIAPSLRGQRDGLETVGAGLDAVATQGDTLVGDVAAVAADLEAARGVFDEFRTAADEAAVLTTELADRLSWQSGVAQIALVVLALAVAVSQTVPIVLGLRILGYHGWPPRRRGAA